MKIDMHINLFGITPEEVRAMYYFLEGYRADVEIHNVSEEKKPKPMCDSDPLEILERKFVQLNPAYLFGTPPQPNLWRGVCHRCGLPVEPYCGALFSMGDGIYKLRCLSCCAGGRKS